MKGKISIERLSINDWSKYKRLRLKALRQDPVAFLESFEEALEKVDDHWMKHLKADPTSSITLFAKEGSKMIGMVAAIYSKKCKTSHVAEIAGNYVDSSHRGKGVGKMMMEAIISEIRKNKKIIKIKLEVVTSQKPAINLYKKYKFKEIGRLKKQYMINGNYYDLLIMERML